MQATMSQDRPLKTPGRRLASMVVCACAFWATSCGDDPQPVTQVVVVVRSDLSAGRALTRLEVEVRTEDGQRSAGPAEPFELAPPGETGRGEHTLPLSFGIVQASDSETRFRVVVSGFGPNSQGETEKIVESKAIGAFQPGRILQLEVWLGQACLERRCSGPEGDEEVVCYGRAEGGVAEGECGPILEPPLKAITPGEEIGDGDSGDGDAGDGDSGDGDAGDGDAGDGDSSAPVTGDGDAGDGDSSAPVTGDGDSGDGDAGDGDAGDGDGPTCQPDCVGRACGEDGCGGSCGTCANGSSCDSGTCVIPPSCGDGSCNGSETQDDCCQDCGCPAPGVCQNNLCQATTCPPTVFHFDLSPGFIEPAQYSAMCGQTIPILTGGFVTPAQAWSGVGEAVHYSLPRGQSETITVSCCKIDATFCLNYSLECIVGSTPVACECIDETYNLVADQCDAEAEKVIEVCQSVVDSGF